MASVGCSFCGYGMHVHDDKNSIVYFLCKASDWTDITSKTTDNKSLAQGKNRSDCLEMEYSDKILEAWRCPQCNSFTAFKKFNAFAESVFTSLEDYKCIKEINPESHYIMYSPNTWYNMTEASIPNNEINKAFPPDMEVVLDFEKKVIYKIL